MYNLSLNKAYFPAQFDMGVREDTVGSLLHEVATKYPSKEALVEVKQSGAIGRRWTYAELLEESERLGLALASRFQPGEHIVVWSPNSPEWVMMEYASAIAGLVLVTANPAFQEKELRYVLEQSDAVALFMVHEYRGNPMADIAARAVDGLDDIREIVDMENADTLFVTGGHSAVLPDVSPDDAAQVQYTSGTTGFPKGAVLSHRGLINNARFYANRCEVETTSTWINMMPMFHTSGCGMVTLGCLQAGCRMVLVSLFDPDVINRLVEGQKASIILGVPTMVIALLDAYDKTSADFSTLELVSCGGAMVAPELVRRVHRTFEAKFSTLYGQTEYCPVITQHHSNDTIEDICDTAGQPVAQTEVSIRRMADNGVCELNEVGEICARGPCTMLRYHANKDATDETVDKDGWLHTGDLGTMDARGYVRITGRLKEMIIRGGENHFPAEIEKVLLEHGDVDEVVVLGLPNDKWGEIIACFIRTKDNVALNVRSLRTYCRQNLAPQKTPEVWCRVEDFPKTSTGKMMKYALRDGYIDGRYRNESGK